MHGTDRMSQSVAALSMNPDLEAPIVFTGAMRPYEMRTTDALQNMTEALLAVQLLGPGVYIAMHNKVLSFPGSSRIRSEALSSCGTPKPVSEFLVIRIPTLRFVPLRSGLHRFLDAER